MGLVAERGGAQRQEIAEIKERLRSLVVDVLEGQRPAPAVAYLRDNLNIEGDEANTALNCSLITWRTNRTIGANEPVEYLKERAEASSLGENDIERRLASHAVPFNALASGDYDEFRLLRAKAFEGAIQKLCSGEHWTPAPS